MEQVTQKTVNRDHSFINNIQMKALGSKAVNHPYLHALATGELPNMELALKDFAYQYGAYSQNFCRYMTSVIKLLTKEKHKDICLQNMEEELGNSHDVELPEDVLKTIIDQPHSLLFRRFQKAIGADQYDPNTLPYNNAGNAWSKQFQQLCDMNQYVGIGAIGIATELIVSSIYEQILTALQFFSDLEPHEHVFFDLHAECDDEHAAQMLLIAEELAVDAEACQQIEYGVNQALALRIEFWDMMLMRAKMQAPAMKLIAV